MRTASFALSQALRDFKAGVGRRGVGDHQESDDDERVMRKPGVLDDQINLGRQVLSTSRSFPDPE
jgi:hypothetical protein